MLCDTIILMEILTSAIDIFLHLDTHLTEFVSQYGTFTYALLFFIIFAETGFVFTPFLPGDSLLFAAGAIAAAANSGMGALYGRGTDRNVGGEKTRLKSEFFKEPDKVREIATNFNNQANEMAKVAASGDVNAVRAQFGKLGDSCKACHDRYRKK